MKFLAILRDSVREALDAKVIYFLLGLSALVILLAFSISFKAEPGDKGLETILDRMPGAQSVEFGKQAPLRYGIEDFKQLNPGKPAWEGEYRCDLVVTETDTAILNEDEDKKEDGQKEDKESRPSQFRLIALLTLLNPQYTKEAELTEEDRQARDRIREIEADVIRGGGKPTRKQLRALSAALTKELGRVTERQLERFLEKQLTTSGTLKVTQVKFVSHKENVYRFQLDCEARPDTVRTWPHEMWVLFGVKFPTTVGVGAVVYLIEDYVVCGLGSSLAMLLGVIVTAFFIPNMLRKGSTDLLISKPIHRWYLLLCKYVGGLSFMFINTVVIVVGIWLALGLRSGLWGTGFLLSIFVLTAQFAIFYAVSTLLAVLTRSAIVCILGCCLTWVILWLVSFLASAVHPFHERDLTPPWVYNSLDMTRKVLPRYKDFDTLNSQLIARDLLPKDEIIRQSIDKRADAIDWGASAAVTAGYVAVLLAFACFLFSVKDY